MIKKNLKFLFPFAFTAILAFAGCSEKTEEPDTKPAVSQTEGQHWSYSGNTGPAYWHSLNEEYLLAKEGKQQSPINIIPADAVTAENIFLPVINYASTEFEIENNGHTIEMIPQDEENYIMLDDAKYTLQQAHFHALSEHQLDGEYKDMEIHLVHKDTSGNIAVIGLLIEAGAENQTLKEFFTSLPAQVSDEPEVVHLNHKINLDELFDGQEEMCRYEGSLTTPPCTEGVKWSVGTKPIEISGEQIESFKALYADNYRPVQETNNRSVYICAK